MLPHHEPAKWQQVVWIFHKVIDKRWPKAYNKITEEGEIDAAGNEGKYA